jgi:hypothetical protein
MLLDEHLSEGFENKLDAEILKLNRISDVNIYSIATGYAGNF